MKQLYYRVLSITLTIVIITLSFLSHSFFVYASGGGVTMGRWDVELVDASNHYLETGDGSDLKEVFQNRLNYIKAVTLSLNAAVSGDALNAIAASESVLNLVPGNFSADEENGVFFGADLVAAIKQALIEYSQETNGFYLLPTTDYRTVSAEQFKSAPQYRTFKNIVEEKGIIVVQIPTISTYSFRFVDPFTDPDNPVSLVGSSDMISYLEKYPWMSVGANFYGTNDWEGKKYRWQVFPDLETVYRGSSGAVDYNTGNPNSDCDLMIFK